MQAWPFFISSHKVQGFTVIVAPDFMCQDGSAKFLASYAGGVPGDIKHHEMPRVEGKTEGVLTLTYRVVRAEGSVVGESVPVLKDAGGRLIPIIEGVVTKGRDKNITLTENDFRAIREACQPAFRNLWKSPTIIPTQPSSPITLSEPFFLESNNGGPELTKLLPPEQHRRAWRPLQSRPPLLAKAALGVVLLVALTLGVWFWVQPNSSPTTLCLATDLPENGAQAAQGRAIRHGVELALKQSTLFSATHHGYHLTEFAMDDSSQQNGGNPDPAQGAKNLTNLFQSTSCPNPVAIIGPYSSSVAQSEIPLAARNHILLISPSNTVPCLTRPDFSVPDCLYDQIHPQGFPNTYARLPGTDIDRGYLSADFLVNAPNPTNPAKGGLGAQKIEIVGDENIAGTQVAQALVQALGQKGMTPIGIDCIKLTDDYNKDHFCSQLSPKTEAFSMDNIGALATKIRDEHVDAVFFGGLNIQGAGLLLKDLRELGLDQVPFVGTGGAFTAQADTFFGTIGSHASNAYTIIAGVDPSIFTTGAPAIFSQQYQNDFGTAPEPLSAGGYDAANIVIQAIKGLIDAGKPVTRESVVQAVLSGNFTGVAGNRIHFDQHGDNIGQHGYTIYQSQQQARDTWGWKVWVAQQN